MHKSNVCQNRLFITQSRLWILALILIPIASASAYNGKLVNAKAVSVQSYYTPSEDFSVCGSGDGMFDGSLMLFTIQNSAVSSKTTIYSRTQGLAHYPAFNLAGSKVAFYREGRGPTTEKGSACAQINGGKSFISVINSDGTNLTDLFELPVLPQGTLFALDWPAGDWIYFEMPHVQTFTNQGNTSLMIWRVNAVTKVAEKVCNLNGDGLGAELTCAYIVRMSLNLAADRMALMCYPKIGCDDPSTVAFFSNVNRIYKFPPPNGNLANADVSGRAGCNISISPSGAQVGSYFAGNHDDLFLNGTDVKISQLKAWSNDPIGNGAECIRWAVNSDKWVLQGIGMINSGHADNNKLGCNQIACNWIDQVAINISKNLPATCPLDPSCVPSNIDEAIITNNDPGDMWISDPTNNPQGDKYEDLQGNWQSITLPTTPIIKLWSDTLFYAAPVGSNPSDQMNFVTNSGTSTLADLITSVSYVSGAGAWLTLTRSGTNNSQNINNSVSSNALPLGTYTAKITVKSAGAPDASYFAVLTIAPEPVPFSGTPYAAPGTIQAENFDKGGEGVGFHKLDNSPHGGTTYRTDMGGVGIESTSDVGGGNNVGYIVSTEWLGYTLQIAQAGIYDFDFRTASNSVSGLIQVKVDNTNAGSAVTIPTTSSWSTWSTTTGVGIPLPAGKHFIKLIFNVGGFNLNYFTIKPSTASTILSNRRSNMTSQSNANLQAYDIHGRHINLQNAQNHKNRNSGIIVIRSQDRNSAMRSIRLIMK